MKWATGIVVLTTILLALLYLLASYIGLKWDDAVKALGDIGWTGFLAVVVLTGMNLALGTIKWLVVMRAMPSSGHIRPRFVDGMLTTTAGAIMGQVMPVQVGVALTRAVASRFGVGGSAGVNLGTTAYEQLFDAVVLCLAGTIGILGLLVDPGPLGWLLLTAAVAAVALPMFKTVRRAVVVLPQSIQRTPFADGFVAKLAFVAARAAQLPTAVIGQLLLLSLFRYAAVLLRAVVVLTAIGMSAFAIPTAIAFPIVQFIGFLPITPGNLGVLEATWIGVLVYAGAALNAAVLFSVTFRIANLAAQVTLFGALMLLRMLPRASIA